MFRFRDNHWIYGIVIVQIEFFMQYEIKGYLKIYFTLEQSNF